MTLLDATWQNPADHTARQRHADLIGPPTLPRFPHWTSSIKPVERPQFTPAWLDDDTAVHRAISARRMQPPSPHFWARLAVLVQLAAAIIDAPSADLEGRLRRANRLQDELAEELPAPAPATRDPRKPGPAWSTWWRDAQPLADLADCVGALAVVLTDRDPPCPEALATLLDELAIALWMCRRAPVGLPSATTGARDHGRSPPTRLASRPGGANR